MHRIGEKIIFMLSKTKAKFIISLQRKKVRDVEGLFVIEGDKIVKEFLLSGMRIRTLVAKSEFINSLTSELRDLIFETEEVSYEELKLISTLKTPHNALAVTEMQKRELKTEDILNQLCVALDFVQDPGNLGTIIRAAGWFGIKNIICSSDCVDVYNPKVVQGSMGALLHVNVYYTELEEFLISAQGKGIPIYGTLLEGEPIYDHSLGRRGVILLGNESKGISDKLAPYITEKIMIPKFSNAKHGIDSLNVSMAASIVFSEFRRRNL